MANMEFECRYLAPTSTNSPTTQWLALRFQPVIPASQLSPLPVTNLIDQTNHLSSHSSMLFSMHLVTLLAFTVVQILPLHEKPVHMLPPSPIPPEKFILWLLEHFFILSSKPFHRETCIAVCSNNFNSWAENSWEGQKLCSYSPSCCLTWIMRPN